MIDDIFDFIFEIFSENLIELACSKNKFILLIFVLMIIASVVWYMYLR